jgi:Icc protein
MEFILKKPIYFVLGNHDFYKGSIAGTRKRIGKLARQSNYLVYLSQEGVVELTPSTALIGHDGWADARCGDYEHSDVPMNDYVLIEELARWNQGIVPDKTSLRKALESLAQEAADHFAKVLPEAVDRYREVLAVTHVPPFPEAAWHQGHISDDNHLPHFACEVVGEVMFGVMHAHPSAKLLVLCGHTHGDGELELLDNFYVWTGRADYGSPQIQRILTVE